MRLLDPFQGYRIASANVYMNLTYLLQISYILWWQEGGVIYQASYALFVMFLTHATCFGFETLRFLVTEFGGKNCVLFPLLLDIFCIVLYQGAIFYIQIVFVNINRAEVDQNVMNWIEIELITYYS